MRYLFFFISFLYSFIYYLFFIFSQKKDIFLHSIESHYNIINLSFFDTIIFSNSDTIIIQSIFWNLIYEAIIFFIIGLFLFFYFWSYTNEEKTIEYTPSHKTFSNIFVKFFKYFSYYIWFLLFYISLYFITTSFDFINFSFFILLINIIIYLLFFLSHFSPISKDFLRINSIIFSIFYIGNYIFIIISEYNYFYIIDFINSFLILLIFPTLLYHDKQIAKKESFDNSILIHFSIYIFVVFLFYFYSYLFHQNLLFWTSFIATLFWIIWLEFLPKIQLLKKDTLILRYIWIILTYIWIIFWVIYLCFSYSFIILVILTIQIFYNLYIHKKYSNYISLFLWIFLLFFVIYYSIIHFHIIDIKSLYFLIFWLTLSFLWILVTYIISFKIILDYYIIHIFAHIFNIVSVIIFFIFNNFEILNIWILLLLESIYFFLSYNKLNPNKLLSNKHEYAPYFK